ncbi:MAG TPA: hypothetical protein VGO46_17065 [Gemmatimonadaceae bacterium]|nr:hypothetical protein [Gemmatimonadaceae bacterium]
MRRTLFGPWRIAEIVHGESWRAVGRWPSLVIALSPSEPAVACLSLRLLEKRLRDVRAFVLALRILGTVSSIALVFGAPVAVDRYGRAGLYYAFDALLVLGALIAILCFFATRTLGARGWTSMRFAITYLWPFAAPYAAERVMAFAIADGSPVDAFRALAGREAFARWARPYAYDALASSGARGVQLIDGFDYQVRRGKLEEMLGVLPASVTLGARICPRCGASYREDVRDCTDCAGVELITAVSPRNTPKAERAPIARGGGSSIRRKRRRKR